MTREVWREWCSRGWREQEDKQKWWEVKERRRRWLR